MGKLLIGLGSGIIITILLLTVTNKAPESEKLTVVQEARKQGMVFPEELENSIREDILKEMADLEAPVVEQLSVEIEIPPNSSASKIAEILHENGFDGEEFLQIITQMDIANKLRYGTFEFKLEYTMEEVIKILTN